MTLALQRSMSFGERRACKSRGNQILTYRSRSRYEKYSIKANKAAFKMTIKSKRQVSFFLVTYGQNTVILISKKTSRSLKQTRIKINPNQLIYVRANSATSHTSS